MKWLTDSWYKPSVIPWLLSPLSLIYCLLIRLRKLAYHIDLFKQHKITVPIIIVGNISVGGTGKTPFVIWLAQQLKQAGFQPGIISRGYGGKAEHYPANVTANSVPKQVGDEPLIISRHTDCPMVVAPNRVTAAQHLLTHYDCNIIIADDGLQHLALARDIEIVIVDSERQFGNKFCLPSGPLREPISRLNHIDYLVYNGDSASDNITMQLTQGDAINLADPTQSKPLSYFKHQTVHAVAGIGNPMRFFDQLDSQDIDIIAHPFADHHQFQSHDLDFTNPQTPILMTEKDAVKCQDFAQENMWYIPIQATISGKLKQNILNQLAEL